MNFELKKPIIYVVYGKARSGKNTVSKIIREYYENNNFKTLNIGYSDKLKKYIMNITAWDGNETTKPRTMLQNIGTDLIRNKIDKMFFVNNLMDDIKVYSYFFDVLTISDARFINEIETPKKIFDNVIIIKVVNPRDNEELTIKEKQHISEIELDSYSDYDYEIINDSDIDKLKEKIIKIVREVD